MSIYRIYARARTAAVLLTIGLPCAAHASPVPSGSYLRSCRSADVDAHGVLSALCDDGKVHIFAKAHNRTFLDLRNCRNHQDIENRNGQLRCISRAIESSSSVTGNTLTIRTREKVPYGSYLRSCRNVTMIGLSLSAECGTGAGLFGKKHNWTSIDLSTCPQNRRDISNRKGRLTCDI